MSDYQEALRAQVLREEAEERAKRELEARGAANYQDKLQQEVLREEAEKWRRYEIEATRALENMGEPWDQASRQHARDLKRKAREASKAAKDIDKEIARQQVAEQKQEARRQVEGFEAQIARLIGEHKQPTHEVDWDALNFSLPPHPPVFHSKHHLRVTVETILLTRDYEELEQRLKVAWSKDEDVFRENCQRYEEGYKNWSRRKVVAMRLRAGDASAMTEAHVEFIGSCTMQNDGRQIVLQPHDAKRVYAAVRVDGRDIIPEETQGLTQAGKVTTKAMPRNKARELYEDHVCSRCLAIARQLFATLPATEVIVTAYATAISSVTGNQTDKPIVSAHFDRERFQGLDFDGLDPSDALQSFPHNGDVRASRRGEDFRAVQPLAFPQTEVSEAPVRSLERTRESIAALRGALKKLQPKTARPTQLAEVPTEINQ